jgi:hypothetical protein
MVRTSVRPARAAVAKPTYFRKEEPVSAAADDIAGGEMKEDDE